MYAAIKTAVLNVLPGSPDADQTLLGVVVLVLALAVSRQPLGGFAGIATVILVGLLQEVADVMLLGQMANSAAHDLVMFTVAPLVLFLAARARLLRP